MKRKGTKTAKDFKNSIVFQRELAEMLGKELKAMKGYIDQLERSLEVAGSACGIAATFLEHHGVKSPQLTNCVKMMQNLERIALKAIAERAAEIK